MFATLDFNSNSVNFLYALASLIALPSLRVPKWSILNPELGLWSTTIALNEDELFMKQSTAHLATWQR